MGITVVAASRAVGADQVNAPAVLALDETRTARLSARAEGTIAHLYRNVGDWVPAETALAELHSHTGHDLLALYRNALAEQRLRARAFAFAKQVEERTARLLAEQAASRQDLERDQSARVSAEQQLAMADTEAQRAQHDLEFFGIEANETSSMDVSMPVKTPIAGTVVERSVTVGTTVTAAMPLFVVSDLSHLWAVAEVDDVHLGTLKPGQSVSLSVAAYGHEQFSGRVGALGVTVDPKTRRAIVRVDVPNPDGRLKPNMFASVSLSSEVVRHRVVVPGGAVQRLGNDRVVFVEESAGRFKPVAVELGLERNGQVEILEGLAADQMVVDGGAFLLKSQFQTTSSAEQP